MPRQYRLYYFGLFVVTFTAGLLWAAAHLSDPLWQDELYTLLFNAREGFLYPFTHYELPNNHVLFSALLAVWGKWNDSVEYLRSFPLLTYAVALLITAWAATRQAGVLAGVAAVAVFATSHVALSFATQLRGYGPSWLPVAAMALLLPDYLDRGGRWRGLGLVAALAAAVVTIPTNGMAWLIVMTVAFIDVFWGHRRSRPHMRRLVVIAASPLLAALIYLPIIERMYAATKVGFSGWSGMAVLANWAFAWGADFAWLLPFLLGGLWVLARESRTAPQTPMGEPALYNLAFLTGVVAVPLIVLVVLPLHVFPRNLVPLLPLWCIGIGVLVAQTERLPFVSGERAKALIAAALVVCALGAGYLREGDNAGYAERYGGYDQPQDVYDQYFHSRAYRSFRVALLVDEIQSLVASDPVELYADFNAAFLVNRELGMRLGHYASYVWYFDTPEFRHALDPTMTVARRVFLLARDLGDANRMLAAVGAPGLSSADLVLDTGYYKLYRVPTTRPE